MVRVAAVVIGESHSLAIDEYGVVWGFGKRKALGFHAPCPGHPHYAMTPTPIPTLRAHALKPP